MNKKGKQPRKGLLERRDRILEAAVEVFAQKGIEQTTIDDIAARAGVGRGTIYRRVGRKEEFIDVLCQHAAKLAFDAITPAIRKQPDSIRQFKEVINVLCDIYETNSGLLLLLMSQLPYLTQDKVEKSCATRESIVKVFDLVEDILQRAIKKGQIRPVDTGIIVKGLIHFLNPLSYQEFRTEYKYTKSEIAQLTIDLFLNGLRQRK